MIHHTSVLLKLAIFSLLMLVVPLMVFFGGRQFYGISDVMSAGAAVLTANIIIITYILVAFLESTQEDEERARLLYVSKKNE